MDKLCYNRLKEVLDMVTKHSVFGSIRIKNRKYSGAKCFGCSRFVYNHFLRLTTDVYADSKKNLRYKEWAKLLTHLKKEYKWLKEVNSQSLQQTLKDLETAYVRFFM